MGADLVSILSDLQSMQGGLAAVNHLREMDLEKLPGVAETIDWAQGLNAIGATHLDEQSALETLGTVVKDRDDLDYTSRSIQDVLS